MNVLIACEESQEVCKAFRERGHNAYSCDVQECGGGHPEWHIQGDVIPLLNGNCSFTTQDGIYHEFYGRWDLIIAHPPCTYLTNSGNRWFNVERYGKQAEKRWRDRVEGAVFFMRFVAAECERSVIENPIGLMGTLFRKADQIINPYEFGHPVAKATCLWLKNVPKLIPTGIVEPERIHSGGKSGGYSGPSWFIRDENGKILSWHIHVSILPQGRRK